MPTPPDQSHSDPKPSPALATPQPTSSTHPLTADDPSPAVTPIFLRPTRQALDSAQDVTEVEAVAKVEPVTEVQAVTPGTETLVDAITRIVSEMLARSLHESVTAAVRALAPRMVISLGPAEPDEELSTLSTNEASGVAVQDP